MLLSILIPTLEKRRNLFQALSDRIHKQILSCNLASEVELLSVCDNGESPTGSKRNTLLEMAKGDYVVFVDDDDEISPDYVRLVCDGLRSRPDVDCLGIRGEIRFRGKHPRIFVHSLRYRDYSSKGGIYTRPPYHLNPIRRSIAASYRFLDVYYSEDIDWALRVRSDARLRTEVFVEPVLYFYHCRRLWAYQWILDRTEGLRHALGLRLTNRFEVYTALRRWMGQVPTR